MENRKLIETVFLFDFTLIRQTSFCSQQMERFKIVERETKTKAYSKEV